MPGRRYYFVYIVANARHSVLYTGVTRDLRRRIAAHRAGVGAAFAVRYHARHLVWYEVHEDPGVAIAREKQLKSGSRRRKVDLVEAKNPDWRDLWEEL
ncbi:MAG: GIY-YIG nuclease family protein [Gemmatimonadota bacterium]